MSRLRRSPGAGEVEVERDEVGAVARARSGPRRPSRGRRGWSRPRAAARAVKWPRRSVFEPQVELDRARLLEQVDDRVAVAAERELRARRRRCRRRGRARSSGTCRSSSRCSSRRRRRCRCVAWTAVSSGRARRARPAAATGVQPCAARQASFSARCSETWKCSGLPRANSTTVASWSGGTARTEWIAAPTFAPLIVATRARPSAAASPSLKRALGAVRRLAEPAGEVARVEQREPDAGLVRGRDQRVAVVQVVELADARDPGAQHLRVGAARRARSTGRASSLAPARTCPRATSRSCPPPRCVRPRSARWNACECALARPGSVTPRRCGSRASARCGAGA